MGIRSVLSKPFSVYVVGKQKEWSDRSIETQKSVLAYLIEKGKNTQFGKDHRFSSIKNHSDFKNQVPIRDYEGLKVYIEKVVKGESNVMWPGLPQYFAKTSGTTSGVKYIPISKESIGFHINGARYALLNYVYRTGKSIFLDGKLMFLSGSPEMEKKNCLYVGRLS